jgi:hypothetical protein
LGIGANTAIFSIIDVLLVQNLPVRHPDELVRLDAADSLGNIGEWEVSAYERLRDRSPAFSGVPMALDADHKFIFGMVVAMRLVIAGLIIGSIAALASTNPLQSMLFGVTRDDHITFIGIRLLLAVISALACYLPARRATRVDLLLC